MRLLVLRAQPPPNLHRVCKQKPTERSRPEKGTLQALAFNSTSQGAPGHSGRLQCGKERPARSDPATGWREEEVFLSPPQFQWETCPGAIRNECL